MPESLYCPRFVKNAVVLVNNCENKLTFDRQEFAGSFLLRAYSQFRTPLSSRLVLRESVFACAIICWGVLFLSSASYRSAKVLILCREGGSGLTFDSLQLAGNWFSVRSALRPKLLSMIQLSAKGGCSCKGQKATQNIGTTWASIKRVH